MDLSGSKSLIPCLVSRHNKALVVFAGTITPYSATSGENGLDKSKYQLSASWTLIRSSQPGEAKKEAELCKGESPGHLALLEYSEALGF